MDAIDCMTEHGDAAKSAHSSVSEHLHPETEKRAVSLCPEKRVVSLSTSALLRRSSGAWGQGALILQYLLMSYTL